jgi:hypothetical protein
MAVPVVDTAYGHIATKEDHVVAASVNVPKRAVTVAMTDTEAAVREYFSDIPVMIQIARCESQFRHTLKDGSVLRGTHDPADTGVMQINTRYHGGTAKNLGLDLANLHDNMAYARDLYNRQGTQPWTASAPCWGSSIAMR